MTNNNSYRYCAGVLPYTYFNNTIYFLLGKSKRNSRLTTFSGKNDEYDFDQRDTAARECYEETLGCIMERSMLLDRIKKCGDCFVLNSTTPRGMPCYTYVIEIPYRKYYVISFHKTRDFLQSLNVKSYALQEMVDIKWICARSMFTKIKKQWEKYGMLTGSEEWAKLMSIAKHEYTEPETWRRFGIDNALSETEIEDE
jgi:hypothetical protein